MMHCQQNIKKLSFAPVIKKVLGMRIKFPEKNYCNTSIAVTAIWQEHPVYLIVVYRLCFV
jgi:hypothetical protein